MGALTGVLVEGPSKIFSNTMSKIQEKTYEGQYKNNPQDNPFTQAKESFKNDIGLINSYSDILFIKKYKEGYIDYLIDFIERTDYE